MLLFPLLVAQAHAFCGTFVATDDAPTNAGSQVAIVKQAGITTLTMANDVNGSVADFALVIPVPEVIQESALHVVDPAIFAHIDGYSAARLVAYECEDFWNDQGDTSGDTGDTTDTDTDSDDTGVVIEGQYVVGEYDIVVLSASESTSLVAWLQSHGYNVPSESQALLNEYIAGGSYFLAAQVRADAGIEAGDVLSPLQVAYTDTAGSLPIRLGTLNSAGSQDLTIFSLTDSGNGTLAISNYPEAKVETDCMLPEGTSFGDHVDATLNAAFPADGQAHWVTEYSWDNGNCDPCTPDGTLTEEDLASLGFVPDYHYGYGYNFTRLHIRYTPEQASQDLVLYSTGIATNTQLRYIEYNHELEDMFPICGLGMVNDPGSCPDTGEGGEAGDGSETGDPADTASSILAGGDGCGCEGGGAAGVLGGLVLLTMAGRVRRR
ncbi:hypothetical protein LBMAG42_53360 [Deltaproteobacteria bacterium]|nr:hypothetical protein LBMAG42_53360 [Deltaproteobacteria bacterium]